MTLGFILLDLTIYWQHRVHHSRYRDETDSNFSFHLSLWDRLYGTYRDQPRDGHERMVIGLP